MTRVRKINLSQVEGDGANNTATNEIRPYGEMGVYVGENNKLELLMFDGVRTNLRSKVLAKGTFYGGDADSGDGNGLDTIKLIPDAVLHSNDGDYDNDQYIIIDPTETNHIHVRAGGAIDASTAFLILGGEENHVGVSDYADQVTIRTNDTHTWLFGSDGHITFPDNTIQTTAYPGNNPNVWVQDFETSLGAPADVPGNAATVEYLANGDIVALFNHYTDPDGRYNSIARFDSTGTKIWSMNFQGATYTDGWGMAVDNAGGFIYVAGRSTAGGADNDVATLTKLSQTDGDVVWSKAYDVGYDNTNTVVDVASDGSPVVVGYADVAVDDEQVVTTKINKDNGSITWSRALNGQNGEFAWGMAVGPNNEVVSVGYMSQLGVTDGVATISIEPVVSNPNWTTGTGITVVGEFTCVVSFTDGVPTFTNIVDLVGGRTVGGTIATIPGTSFGGATPADDMVLKVGTLVANEPDDRMLVVKYDSTGSIQWQKAVQVEVGYVCSGADADIDSTGNIYVCGSYNYDGADPVGDNSAMIIIKFNSAGVKQWTRKVIGPCEDYAASIVVGPDDYLYLSGITGNNNEDDYSMVIAKYNLDGTVVWQRLLDNTTTWTFAGSLWFGSGGGTGSNLAVKDGYVAVAGGYGDPGPTIPHAVVAQITSDGTLFTAGNYDFKAAGFSALLDSSASNITVVNAGKTDSDYAGSFTITDLAPSYDLTSDLIGTLYTQGSVNIDSIDNGIYSVGVGADGVVTMTTSRGTVEFGALPEIGGTTHFHIMKGPGQNGNDGMDLYFGDDFNYVLQRADSYNGSPAYGVEIGTNDLVGGDQQAWRFGTDGDLTIPGNIKSTTDASIVVGSNYSPVTGVNVQTVDELVPPGGVWRIFISATTYSSLGTTVQVGDTVTTTWGTPVTATIIDVLQLDGTWRFHVAQNIVTGFSAGDTVTFNPVSGTWAFGKDGGLTLPGDLHGAEVFLSGEQPEPIVIGHTLNITPAPNASDKKFGFRIDQSDGVYLNSYLDMPTAENNKHVSISFALTDAVGPDSIGYIWNQGTDTNVTNLNNAFNIFANGTNIKLTTQGSDNNQSTWTFGTDGNLTLPADSSILTNETALKIATHSTTTYTFNQAYWEALNGNATRMLTITGNAQYFSCTVTANQDGTYTVADLTGNSFEPGDWFKVPGNELGGVTPANDIQINIATVDGEGVILTTTTTGTAVGKQWQFGTDGNLTLPGNLVIAGNADVFGTNRALIQPADDLSLLALSSGANGAVSSVWVEDIGNVGTSNIAAVYANPTVGSKIVRIVVGQNGVGSGPNLWDFGTDGTLTFPDATVQTTAWTGSRTTVNAITASLANAATGNLTITGYKGYFLYKIQTSAAAWVRIYTDTASRTADAARNELTDPNPGSGVIAEVITTGAETILISPGAMGFSNESTPSTNIELAVTNKSGSTAAITVTLTVLQLEA